MKCKVVAASFVVDGFAAGGVFAVLDVAGRGAADFAEAAAFGAAAFGGDALGAPALGADCFVAALAAGRAVGVWLVCDFCAEDFGAGFAAGLTACFFFSGVRLILT